MRFACHLALLTMRGTKRRFVVMILGVSGAVLMVGYQLSLLQGFVAASGVLVTHSSADLWVIPKGVRAIEFADRVDVGLLDIVRGDPSVEFAEELVVGMAPLRTELGHRISVAVVGMPTATRAGYPSVGKGASLPGEEAVYDASNRRLIDPYHVQPQAEIGGVPVRLVPRKAALYSFLGSPHAFVHLDAGRAMLGLSKGEASYLLIWLHDRNEAHEVAARLARRVDNAEVLPTANLVDRVSEFWLLQTGAGGGFLLAAALGLLIGALTVSQLLWINVLESRHTIACLLASGIQPRAIRMAFSVQGAIAGLVGGGVGAALTLPTAYLTSLTLVPWIGDPSTYIVALVGGASCVSLLAAQPSAARAVRIDPALALRSL